MFLHSAINFLTFLGDQWLALGQLGGAPGSMKDHVQQISEETRLHHAHSTAVVLCSLSPKKVVGCRGGDRYFEGEPLTFGYLVLDDSFGYHYYRLFNVV